MHRTFIYPICLLAMAVCLLQMPETSYAEKITLETTNTHDEQEAKVLANALSQRTRELQRINKDIERFKEALSFALSDKVIANEVYIINKEFHTIKAMAQLSSTHPVETSLLRGFLVEMKQNITQFITPFNNELDTLQTDIKEFLQLISGGDLTVSPDSADDKSFFFFTQVEATKEGMRQTKQELDTLINGAVSLRDEIEKYEETIVASLPDLWKNYYLIPTGLPFDPKSWHNISGSFSYVDNTLHMRLGTEIPQSGPLWMSLFLRMLLACSLFFFLHLLKRYLSAKPSTILTVGALRLCNNSFFWFCSALVFLSALFSLDGLIYYPFIIASAFLLYFAQMSLAWDLYAFRHPQIPRRSYLWPLFIPPCAGLFLLFFDLPPVIVTISWLIVLIITFIVVYHHQKIQFPFYLPRILLLGYMPFMGLVFIMGLLGWARLSIVLSLVYVNIGILLHQIIGTIALSDHISKILPKQGVLGILWGTLLGFLVPVLLMLFMCLAIFWLAPYPGSRYLFAGVPDLILNLGSDSLSFLQILFIISVFFIIRSCLQAANSLILALPNQTSWFSHNLVKPMQSSATYILWGLFGLYALQAFGFNLTNLAVVAGGLSVGIGFGLQHIVGNFFSGLLVIFGQLVRENDVISINTEVDTIIGVVKKINIRSTTVETFDNAIIFIPNESIISSNLTNWTRNGRTVRKKIRVHVVHGTDIPQVLTLLQQVVESNVEILKNPEPIIRFKNFDDGRLNFTINIWVADIARISTVEGQLSTEIEKSFRENNIKID